MIVRVIRPGSDMPGLAAYLWGPGKSDEHTDQRMIASTGAGEARLGDASFFFAGERAVALGGSTLDSRAARDEGRRLERDWRRFREESKVPVAVGAAAVAEGEAASPSEVGGDAYRVDPSFAGSKQHERTGWNRPHVMHVSFSLRKDEGALSDETWSRIAADYVEGMGFAPPAGKDGPGCEWAAWRHGVSRRGNDHMHVAICLVQSDGRWANEYRSFSRSRRLGDELEEKYDLRPVKDSPQQRGMPGKSKAEDQRHRQEPRGTTPERERVAMVVRRAAARAGTEQQFIAEVLRQGVRVRPHFKAGGRDEVVGASFRERGSEGPWLSGTRLGRDLTLPKLRAMWDDTPQRRAEALTTWQGRKDVPRQQARPTFKPSWNAAQRALADWATKVENIDPRDANAWAHTARDAAAVASEFAKGSDGRQHAHMAALAHECSRAAQQHRQVQAGTADNVRIACRHLSLTMRASSRSSVSGWLAVLSQFERVGRAMNSAQRARGEHVRATRLEGTMDAQLRPVLHGLQKASAKTRPPTIPRTTRTTRHEERGR